MGQISLHKAPIYVVSQIAGSLTGYALLMVINPTVRIVIVITAKIIIDFKGVIPDKHLEVPNGHCVNVPSQEISLLQAFLVETIATMVMCFGICSSWDPANSSRSDSVALKIGLIVAVLGMAAVRNFA